MADAKARAAARRQAILASKSDRLAKLTTKAKNEGDVAGTVREMSSDPPLAELPVHSTANTPERSQRRRLASSNSLASHPSFEEDDSFLLPQDQLLRLQALLAASSREGTPQLSDALGSMTDFGSTPFSKPFDFPAGVQRQNESKSKVEKLLPLLHISSTLLFLALVLWRSGAFILEDRAPNASYWRQWANLQYQRPTYSWSGESRSAPRMPMLLDLVMPHLPPPVPVFIQTLLRYANMLGLLADDLSLFVLAIGILIFSASYIS
ncbi:hypothetical protein FRC17_001168 [Serendipita sp. 399]|nr:hypothetical protein FRC17_001168 [Serendipita sp. 399]